MAEMTYGGRLSEAFSRENSFIYCVCLNCKKVYLDDMRRSDIAEVPIGCPNCGGDFQAGMNINEAAELLNNKESLS